MKVNISDFKEDNSGRDINVEISTHDIWNLDHTLALIIHPALIKLKESDSYGDNIDEIDVPDELKMSKEDYISFHQNSSDDNKWFEKCKYVLDEMIWSFDQIANDKEPFSAEQEFKQWNSRVDNGLRLFGKYYRGLWT